MFGIETNQQQINKLEKSIEKLNKEVQGGIFDTSLRSLADYHSRAIDRLENRIATLEDIIKKSGLVEELDTTDVVDIPFSTLLGSHERKYVVNKVKVG